MPIEKIAEFSVARMNILEEEGNVDTALMPDLSDEEIKKIYWYMLFSRVLNTKILNMQRQGRIGTYPSTFGQEAQVAVSFAIKNQNIWLIQSHREGPALIARGASIENILMYWGGYEEGNLYEKELKILPVCVSIGSQLSHALGIAHSMTIKGEKGAAICFFSDGATSEGETLESMNFAGIFKAPVIFYCQNNQYAISVPVCKQTASKTLAQKSLAFGFEGIQIDGNDVFAVYKAVKESINRALQGKGPTLIEAVTYRLDNHSTSDDWKKYRTLEEVEQWKKKDPISRLKNYMKKNEISIDENKMLQEAEKQVEEAVRRYESLPKRKPEDIFNFMYKSLHENLNEQKLYLEKFWSSK